MTYTAHLLVVCHGLWGTRQHVQYLVDSAKANVKPALDGKNEDIRLVVLSTLSNEWTKTYDGIDTTAMRVVQEVDDEIERIREDGGNVKRFSIVGYSLGGLTARYVIGLLHSRTPESFFEEVEPVNFATFASPAIGIPAYASFWSSIIRYLGARLLSRSGSQLYGADRFLPASFVNPISSDPVVSKSLLSRLRKEPAEPLLSVLADPRYSFFKALLAFPRVEIFANSVNDRTVPYPTGAIEAHDPFALARAKARAVMDARGEDSESPLDYRLGGLEIILDNNNGPLIASYKPCDLPPAPTGGPINPQKRRLPLLLRPTTYPFSRPVSLAIIFFLPLALPLSLVYLVGQFLLQGRQSKQRIKSLRTELGGGRAGWLERVGVKLQEAVDVAAGIHDIDTSGSDSSSAESNSPLNVAFDGRQDSSDESTALKHPSFAAFASYKEGTETPPLARPLSPGHQVDFNAEGSKEKPYPTDPVLTDRQIVMIRNLNSIPQLRKHLTFLPNARNAHGTIVCRDTVRFVSHAEGKPFVDFWAKEFVL